MIPPAGNEESSHTRIPCESGDDPGYRLELSQALQYSPRERG